MASKIQSHNFYVAITPYKVQGVEDQYNELSVFTDYNQYTHQFYVSLHAGWKSTFGHGSMIMGDSNPLTASTRVNVKESPRNSQKTINEMGGALELAKADIAWLFDERMFTQLQQFVKDVALYGYTAMLEERIRSYKNERTVTAQVNAANNSNNQTSTTMETKNNNIETKNVAIEAQVNNNAQCTMHNAQCTMHNAQSESVDVAEVNDIVPKVVPRVKADVRGKKEDVPQTSSIIHHPSNQPAVTMPLGQHGSIVIAGVGGKKDDVRGKKEDVPQPIPADAPTRSLSSISHQPSAISHQTSTKLQDSVPQVRLVVYTTKRGDQAPRIEGFGGETDPRWKRHYDEKLRLKKAAKEADKKNEKLKARMKGKSKEERAELLKQWVSVGSDPFNATVRTDFATDNKSYFFLMGAKYMDAARQLVDAYNSGDAAAIAAAEQAVMDVKNGIVAERQAAREERMANKMSEVRSKTEDVHQPSAISHQTSGEKSYTLDEVAAMLGKLLPDGAAKVDDIKKLLKAA